MLLFHVSVRANFVFLFRVYHLHTRVSEENKFRVLRKEKETNCVNICILCVCTCYQRLVHTLLPSWKPCVRMYEQVHTASHVRCVRCDPKCVCVAPLTQPCHVSTSRAYMGVAPLTRSCHVVNWSAHVRDDSGQSECTHCAQGATSLLLEVIQVSVSVSQDPHQI